MPEISLQRASLRAFEDQLRRVTFEDQFASRLFEPLDQVAFYDYATYEYLCQQNPDFK